ncbi:MAG: glutamate--tRNA ligase [Candidatus Aenigmatarchaeota archaeon]
MDEIILKYTLMNAVQYGGKANEKAVIGKIIQENPNLKKNMKKTIEEVKKVIKEVNSWPLEKQKLKLKELGIKIEKREKEEKHELPDLPNAIEGRVVTAFPPEPSKFPHLGHAKAALINYLYAKKYKGKFILRFEDTNPELAKNEYYEAILDGLKWLGIEWDQLDYISDHIEKYYKKTEELLQKDQAYVCFCKSEEIKKMRKEMKECPCREFKPQKNLEEWKRMLSGEIKEGEASVRLKISMSHINAAMRDPSIMRIIDKEHPRTGKKFRVWPMYDFGTAMMDSWEGVTHRVRSKEFELRKELQAYIQKLMGYPVTYIDEIARFNLEGVESSGRKIRELINKGELRGWDDPRLTTLMALRKRGFQPQAIKEFLLSTGMTKTESTIKWDKFESFNRRILDPIANRYFAVFDPIKISINDAPKILEVSEPLHPDYPERGDRIIPVDTRDILISSEDFNKYKGEKVRLIGLFNVILGDKCKFAGTEISHEMPKIQWVSRGSRKIEALMNDGKIIYGIGEPEIERLKEGEIVQFMRLGFFRLVDRNKMLFYFTHK